MTLPPDPEPSQKYRLIAEIGRGGMADVFLAVVQGPAGFNKLVVIKRARAELAADHEILSMFLDEARLAARLNHPNVVQTYEVGKEGDRYYIAMEYLEGQPLSLVRGRLGHEGLPLPMSVRILADALSGLHYAHELTDYDGAPLGVVHRDASPQNIFVTYDGPIKVVDFGIAKAADSSNETRTGVIKGKVTYMSPEQARGERVDRRADVFSIGVILWEAIAGKRMWKGSHDLRVLTQLGFGEIPSLRDAAPDVDPELEAICARALANRPDDRYATAADLQRALEEWLDARRVNVTAREVGAAIAKHFVEDRLRLKSLVESQLKEIRWSGSYPLFATGELPKISARTSMTPTKTAPQPPTTSITASAATVGTVKPEPRPNGRARLVTALGAAVVLGGVAVIAGRLWLPLRTGHLARGAAEAPAERGAPTPSDAAAASAIAPPRTGGELRLVVRVSPRDAKLLLDGAPLSTGAYEGRLIKDGRAHRIRAEAPGFAAQEEEVSASGDVLISLSLQPEPAAPSQPAVARVRPAPKPAPPAASPPLPAPAAQSPKREIDPDSPYSRP